MPRLYKVGGVYYADYTDENGRRRRRSTRCTDKQAAELKFRRWQRVAADPAHATAETITVNTAIHNMLADRRRGQCSVSTLSFYEAKAGHLARVLGPFSPLASVDAPAIDSYIDQRIKEGAGRHTLTKELTTLRITLRVARRRGEYHQDPGAVLPVGWESGYTPRTRTLSRPEVDALLAALTAPQRAWICFALATGASPSEVVAAEAGDIDWSAGVVLLRGTKTDTRWRSVPIVDHPLCPFRHYLAMVTLPLARWHEVARGRVIGDACRRAEIQHATLRDLRRTAGSWLREVVGSGGLVGLFLGHADASMADRVYARLQGEALGRAIAAAYASCVPASLAPVTNMGTNEQR